VFALDQETPQRDHEEDTEEPSAHREQGHLQQLRRHAPHEQGRKREDHAARERTRRGSCRLRDIRFEDAAPDADMGERAKHGNGHDDGDRYRRADRQPGAKSEVRVGRTEDDAEQDPEPDGF
jgi:hypothetical protein